jgi:transcriptional regulator with XRE-family HTH domain
MRADVSAPPYASFGRRLTTLRTNAGLAQQVDLAKLLKTTQQTVSRWELGSSRPRQGQIAALAAILSTSEPELLHAAGYATSQGIATFDKPFPIDALTPETFEGFCAAFLRALYPKGNVKREGGQGHAQDGLDITVGFEDGAVFTFQCKRVTEFGPNMVRAAIKAHSRSSKKNVLLLTKVATPRARRALDGSRKWEIWDREDITRIIRQDLSLEHQRRLVDTYFRGQRLALLGENEPGPWQTAKKFFEPFLDRQRAFSHAWALVGRELEIAQLAKHLDDPKVRVTFLVGAGGTGKSKVLKHAISAFEAKRNGARVYFLAPHDEVTSRSLEDLGSGRKLLVVDDAHDRTDLNLLFQYVAVDANQAHLLIALRQYGMEFVRTQASAFALTGEYVGTTKLGDLGAEKTTELVKQVLREFNAPLGFAESIAAFTKDCPLAAVIGAQIVAREKIPYEFARNEDVFRTALFGRFQEIIAGQIGNRSDAEPVKRILRVLALLQPFYLEDEALIRAIGKIEDLEPVEVNRLIRFLTEAGVLFKRGGTYRLSPDLLADYIIEEACIGNEGISTGYAERVFEAAGKAHLENLLVNLGRLDWRRTNGKPSNSRLLAGLWAAIQSTPEKASDYLPAVTAVAYYQPDRALDFLENQIRAGAPSGNLANVAKYAAYNIDYVPRACELLWELGNHDNRPLNQNPGHAIRVLSELCAVEPNKPLEYNKAVVDFALSLLKRDAAWSGVYTPFDILKGILGTEGHTTTSNGRAVQLGGFLVNQEFVQDLRERVVDTTIDLLSHLDLTVAVKAASFLSDAIRYPMGILNLKASKDTMEKWTGEFVGTIRKIQKVTEMRALDSLVLVAIVRSVSWHKNFRPDGETGSAAKALVDAIPNTLEFRTLCAFTDGWGHHFGRIAPETYERDWNTHMDGIAQALVDRYPDGAVLWKFVDDILGRIEKAHGRQYDGPHILYGRLIAASPKFALETVLQALRNPNGPTARFDALALAEVMKTDRKRGTELARTFAANGATNLLAAVARTYAGCISTTWRPDEGDLLLLQSCFQSKDPWVLRNSTHVARAIAVYDPSLAIQLSKLIDFRASPEATDEVFVLFLTKDLIPFDVLTSADIEHIFAQLTHVPELNGYWTEMFLSRTSKAYPWETAKFFMDRVEQSAAREDWNYRPVNFGPYIHTPLRFRESDQFPLLLKTIWPWMKSSSSRNFYFKEHAGHLFTAMFSPLDAEMVAALEAWANTGDDDDMKGIASILREAPHEFVFTQQEFIVRLLEKAAQLGKKPLDAVLGNLIASAISGVHSGVPGQPMPRDVKMKEDCSRILKGLSRFEPAFRLYDGLLKHAESAIARSLKDAEQFEE